MQPVTRTGGIKQSPLKWTNRGQEWIRQFDTEDRAIAEVILDNLHLVSHEELVKQLRRQCEKIAASLRDEDKLGLYAVQKTKKTQNTLFGDDKQFKVSLSPGRGSEDLVDCVINQIFNKMRSRFIKYPSIDILQQKRVHHIVLVEDSCGSGKRVGDFLSKFCAHPTVKSWTSSNLLKFHLVVYAFNSGAWKLILEGLPGRSARAKEKIDLHCVKYLSPGTWGSFWYPNTAEIIERVCEKYGERHRLRNPKGFKNAMSNVVFSHGTPNNVPGLVWDDKRVPTWKPILGRTLDAELLDCFKEDSSSQTASALLRALELEEEKSEIGLHQIRNHSFLFTLSAIARLEETPDLEKIAEMTTIPLPEVQQHLTYGIKHGFLSAELILTARGLAELKAVRRYFERTEKKESKGVFPAYVPKSFCTGQ